MSKVKKDSLIDYIDTVFVISGEMVSENGEDCYSFAVNDQAGFIGVFDGCGGIGARKYAAYKNKSGAFVASRGIANAACDWFADYCNSAEEFCAYNLEKVTLSAKEFFDRELDRVSSDAGSSAIKGSLASKNFPTTASMVLFENRGSDMHSAFLWAGDSRGFVLNSDGLTQITVDDIEGGGDALTNISDDGKLSNLVCATTDYKINGRLVVNTSEAICITATDGCFGYFSTPMEFEYMLLYTMDAAESIEEWKENLRRFILKYTGDDFTIGVVAFGYKSFKNMKKEFAARKKELNKNYIEKLSGASEEELLALWGEYKKVYYRGV